MLWIGIVGLCSFSGMKYGFHDLWLICLCIHPLNNQGSVPDFVDWRERWESSNIKSEQKEKEDNNIYWKSLDRECTDAFKKMVNKMSDSIFIHLPCYLNSKILYSYMVSDLEALGDHMTCVIFIVLYYYGKDYKEVSIPKWCIVPAYYFCWKPVVGIITAMCLLNQLLMNLNASTY